MALDSTRATCADYGISTPKSSPRTACLVVGLRHLPEPGHEGSREPRYLDAGQREKLFDNLKVASTIPPTNPS